MIITMKQNNEYIKKDDCTYKNDIVEITKTYVRNSKYPHIGSMKYYVYELERINKKAIFNTLKEAQAVVEEYRNEILKNKKESD